MSLSAEEVQKIAHLARLATTETETESVASDLSNILDLVEQMSQVNTDGVVPMAHPLHMVQRLRADEVTEVDEHEKFQSIAPAVENDLYLVPKVIE